MHSILFSLTQLPLGFSKYKMSVHSLHRVRSVYRVRFGSLGVTGHVRQTGSLVLDVCSLAMKVKVNMLRDGHKQRDTTVPWFRIAKKSFGKSGIVSFEIVERHLSAFPRQNNHHSETCSSIDEGAGDGQSVCTRRRFEHILATPHLLVFAANKAVLNHWTVLNDVVIDEGSLDRSQSAVTEMVQKTWDLKMLTANYPPHDVV